MTTTDDRARPMKYIGKSAALLKLERASAVVLADRNPELYSMICSARTCEQFNDVVRMLEDDFSLDAKQYALIKRWIRLERHFSFIRNTPLPS